MKNVIDKSIDRLLIKVLDPRTGRKNNFSYDYKNDPNYPGNTQLAGYDSWSNKSSFNDWLNQYSPLVYDNQDTGKRPSSGRGGDWLGTTIGAVVDLGRDLLGYAHADKAAKVAYDRQNEFYENHIAMPAKVQEFQDAGLNPMALGGTGPGATSAPAVQQGDTPASSGTNFLGMMLDYRLKSRELDIENRRVDVESRRVDLTEQRLPSLIEQALATSENKRKQNEWYDTAISKMSQEINLMDAHIGKVFAETDKINTETFILGVEGKYRDSILSTQLLNLAKDLKVKDSVITKNEADAALSWAESAYKNVLTQYSPALMTAQTEQERTQAAYDIARTSVEDFRNTYRQKHSGAEPPSGLLGAVIGIASQISRMLVTGMTFGLVNTDINPNY